MYSILKKSPIVVTVDFFCQSHLNIINIKRLASGFSPIGIPKLR